MPVEDVFSITGRGTVTTGRIERGVLNSGDDVEIIGMREDAVKSTVTGVEMFHKIWIVVKPGDNVGLLLRGIEKNGYPPWNGLSPSRALSPRTPGSKLDLRIEEERRSPHSLSTTNTVLSSTSAPPT